MVSIYTVVRYGNTPLNSGSLLEQNPILQIVRFSHRSYLELSLTTTSVGTHFKAQSVHFT